MEYLPVFGGGCIRGLGARSERNETLKVPRGRFSWKCKLQDSRLTCSFSGSGRVPHDVSRYNVQKLDSFVLFVLKSSLTGAPGWLRALKGCLGLRS